MNVSFSETLRMLCASQGADLVAARYDGLRQSHVLEVWYLGNHIEVEIPDGEEGRLDAVLREKLR